MGWMDGIAGTRTETALHLSFTLLPLQIVRFSILPCRRQLGSSRTTVQYNRIRMPPNRWNLWVSLHATLRFHLIGAVFAMVLSCTVADLVLVSIPYDSNFGCVGTALNIICRLFGSLSHLRTMLPKSSSRPQPALRPNHAT